jgi:signal transduction histidine kinase
LIRQTHRLSSTLTELLSRARPRHEEPVLLDPCHLVERVVALLRPGMAHKRVDIQSDLDTQCTQVYGDEEWLVQILLNLLMNAEQAMPDGGTITVFVRSSSSMPGYVAISVVDDGPGMSREVLAKALQPFFTTKADGTGLGLTISKELAERMGGVLELESTDGVGTTVRLHLPADPTFLPVDRSWDAQREVEPR